MARRSVRESDLLAFRASINTDDDDDERKEGRKEGGRGPRQGVSPLAKSLESGASRRHSHEQIWNANSLRLIHSAVAATNLSTQTTCLPFAGHVVHRVCNFLSPITASTATVTQREYRDKLSSSHLEYKYRRDVQLDREANITESFGRLRSRKEGANVRRCKVKADIEIAGKKSRARLDVRKEWINRQGIYIKLAG